MLSTQNEIDIWKYLKIFYNFIKNKYIFIIQWAHSSACIFLSNEIIICTEWLYIYIHFKRFQNSDNIQIRKNLDHEVKLTKTGMWMHGIMIRLGLIEFYTLIISDRFGGCCSVTAEIP